MKLAIERGYMMRLAVAQMVLGALIMGTCIWMCFQTNWHLLLLVLVMGWAVLSTGIAQYWKARGVKSND